jgi:hypothetical protein
MKRKHFIVVLVLFAVLCLGAAAYSKRHVFFPSQQMKDLRQLEAHLDLPKPKYRKEVDSGYNTDAKGAKHFDRHIALSYEDDSTLNLLRTKLLADSWKEQPVDSLVSFKYFTFKKGDGAGTQCVTGYSKPKDNDGIALYVSLEAPGDYSCNPAPGI